ncbi:rhomboid family intramembrane serine protease [Actinotalea sp.]|uniref:rhomboid family intramembrane serine protease n=1 Tax=Actinotalea sp. TaxID=1872145 RepID=UPI002BFAB923|nr:rhomboid family intramembrane serine protease [Actinotalea sp.]HQY34052.1 rhomboid family intramembrane serine protease [Actinotalea sp.]HRA50348.1 rhomboid family intramembrane serine protease [Actinotalea sp.]
MSDATDQTGAATAAVPVCPRHPDRVSYVRCQRCGRPTCPECQRTAAVGVHCVDCVRAAVKAAPQARTAFGAPLRGGRPVVTLTLIGLNVVSFLLQLTLGAAWTSRWVFSPAIGELEPWRFLTTAFLHDSGSLLHIGFNMYALWVLGQYLEPALGRWRFTALYLTSALGGSVLYLLLASPTITADDPSWITSVVGASGAVFGLFGAIIIVLRRLGRSARSILVVLAFNAAIPFFVPRIAWEAHAGGLLVGLLLGAVFAYAPKSRRVRLGVAGVVATTALLVALAVLKYAGA